MKKCETDSCHHEAITRERFCAFCREVNMERLRKAGFFQEVPPANHTQVTTGLPSGLPRWCGQPVVRARAFAQLRRFFHVSQLDIPLPVG